MPPLLRQPQASARANALATRHRPSNLKIFLRYRKSAVPEGGWTHENFVGKARVKLRLDMLFVHRAAVARMMRGKTKELERVIIGQIERILAKVERGYTSLYGVPLKDAKAEVHFDVPSHASMWATAIDTEMQNAGHEVSVVMGPSLQSVADDVYGKVAILLGHKPTRRQIQSLGVRVRTLARNVTQINNTTKRLLQETIADSMRQNHTVFETIAQVRDKIPSIASNRVATIVRTEVGRASDQAIKAAMVDGGTVTHFDVIGCQKVEPRGPTFQGVPTCNIEGVPIAYENQIEFHINHTGCIVASMFRTLAGEVPEDPGLHTGEELLTIE